METDQPADENTNPTPSGTGTSVSAISMEMDAPTVSPNNSLPAPVLSVNEDSSEIDPKNVMRSPPKLLPAVPIPELMKEETPKSLFRNLTGSMKNTPASLSIIDTPASLSGKSTRSTRSSIDPTFAAKQRSFLHKVHSALSSTRIEDTSSCDSDVDVLLEDLSENESSEFGRGSGGSTPKRLNSTVPNALKRRREEKEKDVLECNGGSTSATTNGEDSESHPPAVKKPCNTVLKIKSGDKPIDAFCWYCHREDSSFLLCASCPRVFHNRCLRRPSTHTVPIGEWVCPECVTILRAENSETRSKALRMLSLDQLCDLLQFAVDRMKSCPGAEVFDPPVDLIEFPSYKDYIVNPMHLSLLERNIKRRMYGSTEAFVADAAWIVHNCIIFNSYQSKLTSVAKNILRVCKQEMSEIENCPDCYKHAYTCEDNNWFIQVCRKPHLLVWAKLKGFPHWPAKAMRVNSDGAVDARFFGAHDRSWVPARDCFLYSHEYPSMSTHAQLMQSKKRSLKNNLDTCIEEVELHIEQLREKFLEFNYAPVRTPVIAKKMDEQLKILLPKYKPVEGFEVSEYNDNPQPQSIRKESTKRPQILVRKKSSDSLNSKISSVHISAKNENMQRLENNVISNEKNNILAAPQPSNTTQSISSDSQPSEIESDTEVSIIKMPCSVGQSEATIIAEQRLKKRDARKIGLVDRLQEKLSQWLSSGSTNKLKESSNSDQKDEITSASGEAQNISDLKKDESAAEFSVRNEEVSVTSTGEAADIRDIDESNDENQQLVKHLLLYNMSKCQPKVMLQKLVLNSTADEEKIEAFDPSNCPSEKVCFQDNADRSCREHEISGHSSSPEVVLECVVENVTNLKEKSQRASNQSEKMDASLNALEASEKNSVCVAEKTKILNKGSLTSQNSINKCIGSHQNSIFTKKTPQLIRVLSSEALGLKPVKDLRDVPKVAKSTTLNNTVSFGTKITVSQSGSIYVNNEVAKLHENGSNVFETERSSVHSDISVSSPAKSPEQCVINKRNSSEGPAETNSSCSEISSVSSTLTPSSEIASSTTVKAIHIKPFSIPQPRAVGSSQISDRSSPISVPFKSIANRDGRVGNLLSGSGQVSKFVQILPKSLSTSQPATLTPVTSSVVSQSITLSGGKKASIITVPSVSSGISVISSQNSVTTKPVTVTSAGSSTASRSVSLSGSKAAIVTVSAAAGGDVPIARRILPRAIALSPASVLVASRSGSNMPRISVGPLHSPPSTPISSHSTAAQEPRTISVSAVRNINANTTTTPIASQSSKSNLLQAVGLISTSSLPGKEEVQKNCDVEKVSNKSVSQSVHERLVSVVNAGNPSVTPGSQTECESSISYESILNDKVGKASSQFSNSSHCNWLQSTESATDQLRSQAVKLSDMFMNCMQDYLREMGSVGNLEAQVRCLQLDMEHMQWRHKQEMDELRHNTDLLISEIRDSFKVEAQRAVADAMKIAREEKETAIAATKRKQWCAFCGKEAMFYCCWNTSYCDFKCQENHWPAHSITCMQSRNSCEDRLAGKVDGRTAGDLKRDGSRTSTLDGTIS